MRLQSRFAGSPNRPLGLSVATLCLATACLGVGVLAVGCGSDPAPAAVADTGTGADSVSADTGTKVDTGTKPDTDISSCAEPLATGFKCVDPDAGAPATDCSDSVLADFVAQCVTAKLDVPASCAAWKTANPTCAACVASFSWDSIPGKVYPDDYKCYWRSMDGACAKAASCSYDCQDKVCGTCDADVVGSDGKTERDVCVENAIASGGACYAVAAKDATPCFEKYTKEIDTCSLVELYKNAPDVTALRQEILEFYRGACRDKGDWTKKGTAISSDAGTDGATDGASDGAATDGAATDGAATDAGAAG